MTKQMRFFAVLIAATMVLSTFFGCGGKKDSKPDGAADVGQTPQYEGIMKEPADGIGEPGKDFVKLESGPADDWPEEIPVPGFNPLGSYALYSEARVMDTNDGSITLYTLDGYTEKRETKEGRVWDLTIVNPDHSLYWLRWYVREAGGQWFAGTRDHSAFVIKESDRVSWWADACQTEQGVNLRVVQVNTLPIGQPVTIRTAEHDGGYTFYSPPTNGKLQSATVRLKGAPDCGVRFYIDSDQQWGRYSYATSLYLGAETVNLKKTDRFVLDDLPITEGELRWRLEWDPDIPVPEEITIQLDTPADVPPVVWGESPGAIRVAGIPSGTVKVKTAQWALSEHSEVSLVDQEVLGFTDQNGDMFFPAPAGYYQVIFTAGISGSDNVLRLVPVNAGEVTTVTIPPEAKAASGAISRLFGDFEENQGGIELLGNAASGNYASATFVLNDPLERDLFPKKEDIKIAEEGVPAVVTDIQRQPAGSSVVLVLDSSGSMGENMKPCIEAAKRFVQSLPENSTIQLIQFAQKITEHRGNDKASVLKALDTVKEGGATALYDATARGLSLLSGKERGYVVVFSDGADSREPNIDGEGSKISKEEILEQIAGSGVTVLTIGFGAGHDPSTLVAMSAASQNGGYFAAADKSALDGAFASVAGKFGNQFTVTYERPVIPTDQSGTKPVVSFMIDTSGSMDMDPMESPDDDVGWRMDRMKAIFHDFVLRLPQGTLMQLGSFASPGLFACVPIGYQQYTTDQKGPVLQALGYLYGSGGTPTNEALNLSYYNLASVPSQKRVLIFFTDLALYDPAFPEENNDVFARLKSSGIQVLFAGLSNDADSAELETIFKTSAQKAGGNYILTDNPEDIGKKLEELLSKMGTPAPKKGVDFSLGIDCLAEDGGQMRFYTTTTLDNLTPKTGTGKRIDPQMVKLATGERHIVYNGDAARLLYGGDQPGTQSNVLLRIPFTSKQGSNKLGKLSVSETYLMDVFKGIPAPSDQLYLALNVTLEFDKADKTAKEIGYSVPNVFNHFYLSANEGRMNPPSQATWLTKQPFANPGEPEVTVFEKEPRSGALVFLVDQPDGNKFTQLSLHFYDTQYGHIELPLCGRLSKQMLAMDELPARAPQEMSKAFGMILMGQTDQTELEGVSLMQEDPQYSPVYAKQNASFRVLEAKFDSRVQALLDIDPVQRFLYKLETAEGSLMVPMSPIVHNLPLGFVGSTMLAPGSCSRVRMPFVLPNKLLKSKASVYADLATGSKEWSVTSGTPYSTGTTGKKYTHEYFDLTINSLSIQEENSSGIVLDFTLHDKKDGEGTGGLESILQLERITEEDTDPDKQLEIAGRSGLANFAGGDSTLEVVDTVATNSLIFGALQENGSWGAFDGQSRRGIFLFHVGDGTADEWMLTSSLLPDLKLPVSSTPYPYPELLTPKPEITIDEDFDKALEEAVNGAIAAYEATRTQPRTVAATGLSDDEVMGGQVPSPSLTLYGSQRLQKVASDADFLSLMRSLRWIPSDVEVIDEFLQYRYAPEAVITQGWGGQHDLTVLARTVLAQLGYRPEYRTVTMTEAGMEALKKLSGMEPVPKKLTGVFYLDANGSQKLFVPILNADLADLPGLGYLATNESPVEIAPIPGSITIELFGRVIGNAGNLMQANTDLWGSLGAAMEGDEYESGYYETVPILQRQVSMPDMSLDSIDISYLAKPKADGGSLLLPVLDTRQGLIYDPNTWVDSSYYEFKRLIIRLDDGNTTSVHTTILPPEQKVSEIIHTLAWGVPELTAESAKAVEAMAKSESDAATDPAAYSVCRWLGHATAGRLVMGLSEASRSCADKLDLIAGRSDQAVALLVTTKSDGKTAETSVDLVNHRNQLHDGDETARNAYNIMYGYFASEMEAAALPGDKAIGYTAVWDNLPKDAAIHVLGIEDSTMVETAMTELGKENYPPLLWERMSGDENGSPPQVLYLVPDRPALMNGKPRWAWLEIDMETCDVVSVFENGQRSAMTEFILGCLPGNGNYAEVGAGMLVGVTSAVGSVSAYTLTGMDYKDVMKKAEDTCKLIGAGMDVVLSGTGVVETGGGIAEGRLKGMFGVNAKIFFNKVSFVDAYRYGVDLYFKNAKASK